MVRVDIPEQLVALTIILLGKFQIVNSRLLCLLLIDSKSVKQMLFTWNCHHLKRK